MMKNKRNPIVVLCFACFFALLLSVGVGAEEYTFEGMSVGLSSLYDTLPEELQKEFGEFSSDDPAKTAEELTKKLEVSYWLEKLADGAKIAFFPALRTAASILGMLILTSSLRLLSETVGSGSLGESFSLCSDVCVASVVLTAAEGMVTIASAALDRLCTVMNVMIPVTEAVCLMDGGVTQLTVHRSAMLLYIGIAGNINNLVLKPLFGVLFGFAVVTSVFGKFGLSGFIGGIHKGVMIVISLCTMLFSFVLGLQTVLAKSADSLALKTVRLALGSFIPIVGGTLSEALTTVKEGFGVVRNITGVGGVVIILLLVLPSVLSLLANSIVLSLCHTAAEILGCGTSAAVIGEMRGVLSILSAIVYATSLLFIMAMFLFAKVGVGG